MSSHLPLASLEPGTRGVVVGVVADGPIGRRLLDLGFSANTEVQVVRRAPLGDPSVYQLRGTQLCLRRTEALLVQVLPLREGIPAAADLGDTEAA
jgi:ferrous iron transport protein A